MSDYYVLNANGDPEPCGSVVEWAEWFEKGNRVIGADFLPGDVRVSTVFLGLDHAFGGATPVLFETMVFGGPLDQEQERYHTRTEAVAGHAAMVGRVKESAK